MLKKIKAFFKNIFSFLSKDIDAFHRISSKVTHCIKRFCEESGISDHPTTQKLLKFLKPYADTVKMKIAEFKDSFPTLLQRLITRIKTSSPWQLFRISLGIFLLFALAYFYIPRIFHTYSTAAVVTAKLIPIRAPISGYVETEVPPIGTEIDKNTSVLALNNPNVDKSELDTLTIEMESLKNSINATEKEMGDLKKVQDDLSKSRDEYVKSLIERTTIELEIAKTNLKESQATFDEDKKKLERKQKLGKKGYSSQQDQESADFSTQRAEANLEELTLQIKRYETQIESLRKGIFINTDGRTDVSYQEQRINDIRIKLVDMNQGIDEKKAKITVLQQTIKTKTELLGRLGKSEVKLPVQGAIWKVHVSKGNYIEKNTPLFDVIDCNDLYVSATVSGKMFERLKVGQKAKILLNGADRYIDGHIAYMRGSALDSSFTSIMVGRSTQDASHDMEILVKLDTNQLKDMKGDFCNVGRVGDVRF